MNTFKVQVRHQLYPNSPTWTDTLYIDATDHIEALKWAVQMYRPYHWASASVEAFA
jgi:hypothetical protein